MQSGVNAPTATSDAAGFLVPALLIPTFFVDSFFHEGGHAVVCVLQGNRITTWRLELPAETCCTSYNAISYAAGTITSLAAWTVCTVIFARLLLPRLRQAKWLQFSAVCWVDWSFWCLGELVLWALQVRPHPAEGIVLPPSDAGSFARLAGVNPNLVTAVCLGVLAVLLVVVFVPCAVRVLRAAREPIEAPAS
jgi:hypothetical protein